MKGCSAVLLNLLIVCATTSYANENENDVVTIERATGEYQGIAVSGFYEIEFVDGQEGGLIFTGVKDVLDNIESEVKDDTLYIRPIDDDRQHDVVRDTVVIKVPVEEINKIQLSGSGKISGKVTLKTKQLDVQSLGSGGIILIIDTAEASVQLLGSGAMKLTGETKNFSVRSSGSSNLKAYGLIADEATLQLFGSADIETTVKGSLAAKNQGSGNILYRGNPELTEKTIMGSGKISKSET